MALQLPDFFNGPVEVGLAATGQDAPSGEFALHLYPSIADTVRLAPWVAGLDVAQARLYSICALTVASYGWWRYGGDMDSNVVVEANPPAADARPAGAPPAPGGGAADPAVREIDQEWVDGVSMAELVDAATFMAATKVNLWSVNHHTGQGSITGYSAKVARKWANIAPATQVPGPLIRLMWVAGHWCSTKGFYRAFGVMGVSSPKTSLADIDPARHAECRVRGIDVDLQSPDGTGVAYPSLGRDAVMRIQSGPAGAAAATTYRAIVEVAARSAYSVLLPPSDDYAALAALPPVQCDGRNHVGSMYITGLPYVEIYCVSEETRVALSAFVHAVAPESSLARAKVIMSKSDVLASDVYTRILSVRVQLHAAGTKKEQVDAVAAAMGAAVGGDPLAAVRGMKGLAGRAGVVSSAGEE